MNQLTWRRRLFGMFLDDDMLRHNAIDIMRLVLACLVVVSHSFSAGGFGPEPVWEFSQQSANLGGLAVIGFFGLSGFLITRSYLTIGKLLPFLWHRVLRIMPGFWVCLLVVASIFGPLIALQEGLPMNAYLFAPDGPTHYVWHNAFLTIRQDGISGLLSTVPHPNLIDASLWTLVHEFHCYLVIAAFGILGILRRARPVVLVFAALLLAFVVAPEVLQLQGMDIINQKVFFGDPRILQMWAAFFVGASLCLYRDIFRLGAVPALLGLLVAMTLLHFDGHRIGALAIALSVPYFLLWAAFAVRLPRVRADFSYGIYVYAWPIQQLLAVSGAIALGAWVYIALAFAGTLPLAAASWFLVESRALRLKRLEPLQTLMKKTRAKFAPTPLSQ
jgi:peptidoglycan/LPS O-acetylase OafA/YrhL